MHVRCPHCHQPVELVENVGLEHIDCPSCGSHFSLLGDQTASYCTGEERKIGHFELIERLGMGQFGTVWMARDTELDRAVALKIPRQEELSPSDVEMFLREARAAAQLHHPNIVSVHEVGREGDTVFIVSDLVRGVTLADRLTAGRLSPREAARLCVTVAEALQHAHQAGVIHRDLKPSNIMLDADGQPHLMDFGLAKREAAEITMTMDGKILGTPAYMSPEQARGEAHAADARSDIYSLGTILFELLTGELPFRGNKRMLLLQIIHDEPPSPRKLDAAVPRDLETICLKCLEKPPERRFATARGVADELRRFVSGEPIHARPVRRIERSWRWCRRNPLVASLAASVITALVTGAGVSTYFAIEERTAKLAAEQAAVVAKADRDAARRAIDNYVKAIKDEGITRDERFRALRQRLLADARRYYEDFIVKHSDDPNVDEQLAAALAAIGEIDLWSGSQKEAAGAYQQAVGIYERLVDKSPGRTDFQTALAASYDALGWMQQSSHHFDEALRQHERALQLRLRMAETSPDNAVYQRGLADSYEYLGFVQREQKELASAFATYQRLIDMAQATLTAHPNDLAMREKLGSGYFSIGTIEQELNHLESARNYFERALCVWHEVAEAGPRNSDLQSSIGRAVRLLGDIEHEVGNAGAARQRIEKALEIFRQLATDDPHVHDYQDELAYTLSALGKIQAKSGDYESALASHQEVLGIEEALHEENPDVVAHAAFLAAGNLHIGSVFQLQGNFDAALPCYQRAIEIGSQLLAQHPSNAECQSLLASAYWQVASLNLTMKRHAAAASAAEEYARYCDSDTDALVNVARILAQCRSLLDDGQHEEDDALRHRYCQAALRALRAAIRAGFHDYAQLSNDPDLCRLRDCPGFLEFIDTIK